MKQQHNPEDREPNQHPESLEPGEIDFTGAVQQDLSGVIGDALLEAHAADGQLPAWGARAIARALANRTDNPITGALHHFAATGRISKEAITSELAEIHDNPPDSQTAEQALLLGLYIDQHADEATSAGQSSDPPEQPPVVDAPSSPTPPQRPSPEQFLEAHDDPVVAQGLSEHGAAFRAYLQLPDTDPEASDLLERFEQTYIDTYASINELAENLTELPACEEEVDRVAARWGFDGLFTVDEKKLRALADLTWDIVEIGGKLYVFSR